MADNSVYLKLADEFGYPGSANCVDYLRILFTPEEGELLREFIEPATCQEVSTRPKMDARGLQDKLDNFMARGLLFHGKTQYVFQLGIHVFFNRNVDNQEEYIPPDFWDVYKEFHLEEIERLWLPQQTKSALASAVPGNRVIPHRLALAASPKIRPAQVLWHEDYAAILKRAEIIGVIDCACRKENHNCDRPLWTCLYLNDGVTPDLDPKRQSRMKIISADEAIAYADEAERGGLMHLSTAGNNDLSVALPPVLCNCCADCCTVLAPAIRSGRLRQLYAPSRFIATVDTELCNGCQICVDRCFFNAIEMRKTLTAKKRKAHVLVENCMGCGSCVVGCKHNAVTLELVRPPEHIPVQKPRDPFYDKSFGYRMADLE